MVDNLLPIFLLFGPIPKLKSYGLIKVSEV